MLITSALIHATAVLGVEALGCAWASGSGMDNLIYDAVVILEESLELAALILALYGVNAHLEARGVGSCRPSASRGFPSAGRRAR